MFLTKKEIIKTFVGHKLIDKYLFFSFDREPEKLNQVSMLELCYKENLVLKLLFPLT